MQKMRSTPIKEPPNMINQSNYERDESPLNNALNQNQPIDSSISKLNIRGHHKDKKNMQAELPLECLNTHQDDQQLNCHKGSNYESVHQECAPSPSNAPSMSTCKPLTCVMKIKSMTLV
jgi:hypothetical protein